MKWWQVQHRTGVPVWIPVGKRDGCFVRVLKWLLPWLR